MQIFFPKRKDRSCFSDQSDVYKRQDKEQSARSLALEQEKNRQLVNRMSTLESNASKYDEACAQVGAALLDAHQDAQRIREKARQEAAAFTDGAVQTAQSVMDGVHSLRSNLDAVRDRIRSIKMCIRDRFNIAYNTYLDLLSGISALYLCILP